MVMVDAWAMNDVQYKSKFIIGQKLTSGENLNTENYVFGHVLNMRERGVGRPCGCVYDMATTDALYTENDLQMIRTLTGDQLISRYQDIPPSQRLTDAFIGKLGDSECPGTAKRTIGLIFVLGYPYTVTLRFQPSLNSDPPGSALWFTPSRIVVYPIARAWLRGYSLHAIALGPLL
ncbi:hypothetical protein BJV77DRAFT_1153329 [Russula vinacea]|nr:hypothetical protein BJV77DRAFT_1153329 [Russula vinacea]